MTVKAILSQKGNAVVTEKSTASIADIANDLAKKRIGAIVVLDENDAVCGIISERDVVREIATHGKDALDSAVSVCMTKNVISCTQHNTINEVMEIMSSNRFRHLPVIEDGELQGIISIGDVVKRKIESAEQEAEELKSYIAAG